MYAKKMKGNKKEKYKRKYEKIIRDQRNNYAS
jgi:hypothetical protein